MSRTQRLLIAGGILLALLLLAAFGGWRYLRAGFPDYEQELALDGLTDTVTVYRDDRGVAHLEATSEADLFFAQGYIHAQERLWQMEFQRRVVEGRLSELFGESQLGADRFLRTIGLHRIARRVLAQTLPEGRAVLERYAAGVNAFLETTDRLPLEFRVLGFEPEPWEPVHSTGLVALMAYNLGDNWRGEATRLAVREAVGDTLFQEILPPYDQDTPAVWDPAQAHPEMAGTRTLELLTRARLGGLIEHLPRLGSNSWAVAPERSASGRALLGNDPHLQLNLPVLWYENRLRVTDDDLHVYGWSVPGGPGVIIGHTEATAWGMTNTGDTQDLFLEESDPDDPNRLRYGDAFYEAERVIEEIHVSGREEPVEHEVRLSYHGPIVEEAPLMSLRWTAYEVERSTIDAVLQMNRANDWPSFRAALEHFTLPAQAVVYADTAGTIAFRVAGDLPIRREGRGLVPAPGHDPIYGWERPIPFEELPELVDPPQGYVATANHRVTTDEYPYDIVIDYSPGYRMQRITDVLNENPALTLDDLAALQTDWTNLHAARRVPQFVEAVERHGAELSDTEARGLDLLQAWARNPVNSREAAAPALFQTWYLNLIEAVFEERMGPEIFRAFIEQRSYLAYNALEHLLDQEESAWFPDGLDTVLYRTYAQTVAELERELGASPETWRWDQVQTAYFAHALDESALLRPLVSSGPHPYGGDHMTVGRAAYTLDDPFRVVHGAGLRFLAELDAPIRARAVVAGGQSGHPRHRHYTDQLEAWLAGRYYKLSASDEASYRMVLRPPGE